MKSQCLLRWQTNNPQHRKINPNRLGSFHYQVGFVGVWNPTPQWPITSGASFAMLCLTETSAIHHHHRPATPIPGQTLDGPLPGRIGQVEHEIKKNMSPIISSIYWVYWKFIELTDFKADLWWFMHLFSLFRSLVSIREICFRLSTSSRLGSSLRWDPIHAEFFGDGSTAMISDYSPPDC